MHPIGHVEKVLALHGQGLSSYAILRKTGIARSTLLHWLDAPGHALAKARSREVSPLRAPATYAYLLGLYLGDGWIRRGITRARSRRDARAVDVSAYGGHWPTLFPQHGPGRKHHRSIVLTGWQRDITLGHPEDLLRGLIQSDGCRVIASVRAPRGRRYSYARYYFSNRSADIRAIFCEHLDLLSIDWTQSMDYVIQVARRPVVQALDQFVGPKL